MLFNFQRGFIFWGGIYKHRLYFLLNFFFWWKSFKLCKLNVLIFFNFFSVMAWMRNINCSLRYLNVWSPVRGTVWLSRCVILLKRVCHWSQALRFKSSLPFFMWFLYFMLASMIWVLSMMANTKFITILFNMNYVKILYGTLKITENAYK